MERTSESLRAGSGPTREGRRRLPRWFPLALCSIFLAILWLEERRLLLSLNGEQPLPSACWRLLWPLGCLGVGLLLADRVRWHFLAIVGLLSCLALALDRAYYDFFRSVPSVRAATSARQLWDVRDSVAHLVSLRELGSVAFFALLALHGSFGRLLTKGPLLPGGHRSFRLSGRLGEARCAGLTLLAGCALLAWIAWHTPVYEPTHHLDRPDWVMPEDHWASRYSNASYAATFGVFNYHAKDVFSLLRQLSLPAQVSPDRREQIQHFLQRKQHLNRETSPFFGLASGRNVVMIQMESWQHLVLDLRVEGTEVTPTLNRLKQAGLSWDFIVDVTHLGRTSDGEFAVLAGLLPDTRQPVAFSGLHGLATALPRELKRRGYRTASFHGYKRAFWNRAYTHPEFGIDQMFFQESFTGRPELGLGTTDPAVFEFVVSKLAESEQPTFALVISLSSHHPYVYTPPEYERFFPALSDRSYGLLGPYLRAVRYADDALETLVDAMAEQGLLERTLFVIYGDHDMGGVGARRPLEAVGPAMFTPLEDRVPLVIWIPGEEAFVAEHRSEVQGATGGLHDLFPTVLHLLGIETPLGVQGTHLFVPDERRDPVPLPAPAGAFAYRQAIYTPLGAAAMGQGPPLRSGIPHPDRVFEEQRVVRDLLDGDASWVLAPTSPESRTASR